MEWTLEVVLVPVSDMDRAKRFYSEQVGFTVDNDAQVGVLRNVQLTPPGSGCSIVLGTVHLTPAGPVQTPPGSAQGLQLVVSDLEAAREGLAGRGVEVSEIHHFDGAGFARGRGGRWNAFVFFDDPDGNGWVVQERPANG